MTTIEFSQEQTDIDGSALTKSPLVSTGIQARNFTTAFNCFEKRNAPAFYSSDSLAHEVELACDPHKPISDASLLNIAVKYFFAYVHDACDVSVPYEEIATLYGQFSRHQSMNEPADDIEIMNRLRMWSSVLRVLADVPRAASVMRCVLSQSRPRQSEGGPFVGVDLGTGTGIVLLALQIQARRSGFSDIQTLGFQSDPVSGERTHDLIHALGAGSVMLADPTREGAYAVVRGRNIDFVANETLAGIQQSLSADNCFRKYQAFFAAVGKEVNSAVFFPDGVIAYSAVAQASVILAKENEFQPPLDRAYETLIPQGLFFDGALVPIHKLGQELYHLLV
ncbi:hypothetical protein GO013_11505 [Pseudodesulfovibrio sp. JC047]|uniref:hypothetical protein n=1 Tax=Pseudodesulfovibrio sp. JC047 TaxID=2683199 RepID=UPI0013D82AEC|nr:hypothetical protein [Pseudodesulfovibrio sp. JC047]NDV20048.1 hypothetical protein [Pseudodesulfovibrio sp. JC047]